MSTCRCSASCNLLGSQLPQLPPAPLCPSTCGRLPAGHAWTALRRALCAVGPPMPHTPTGLMY
eukprot:901290-Prymnesium_polylepis.3